jgi:hypothetical protein
MQPDAGHDAVATKQLGPDHRVQGWRNIGAGGGDEASPNSCALDVASRHSARWHNIGASLSRTRTADRPALSRQRIQRSGFPHERRLTQAKTQLRLVRVVRGAP